MAQFLPPAPSGIPPGHAFWNDWYEKLRTLVNNTVNIAWSAITGTPTTLAGYGITDAGTVKTVSVVSANGVSGSVATATTTPAITLSLGAITPSSVVSAGSVTGTNHIGPGTGLTGTASSLTAGSVTTNANLTGPITSVGNATAVAAQTGTGSTFVMNTSPTLVTPLLGVATGTSLATTLQVASTSAGALTVPSISARFNAANLRLGFVVANSNGFAYVGMNTNPKAASDTATYDITQAAAQLRMDNDQYLFNLAASGTAGTDITWTTAATLTRTALTVPGTLTTSGGASFHTTSTALTNGAGAAAGTLLNAPAAGNPTKWIGINDNGTVRYIPAW
jgi:hypothetical protein